MSIIVYTIIVYLAGLLFCVKKRFIVTMLVDQDLDIAIILRGKKELVHTQNQILKIQLILEIQLTFLLTQMILICQFL